MQVRTNTARQILSGGGTTYSSAVRLPEPGLCEILGYAGFDFVLIDGEHGAVGPAQIDRMVQGCLAGGAVPVVRVLRNDDAEEIMRTLDLGAQGVLIPHCCTAEDARAFRRAALYPPAGRRGYGPGRGIGWGGVESQDYFRDINQTVLLIALIEDPQGVDHVEEIAAAGLDCLWVGTGDLALSYGVPGERDHPKVRAAADRILKACKEHGVAAGWPASSAEDALAARELGFRAIGFGGAESFVFQSSRDFLGAVKT